MIASTPAPTSLANRYAPLASTDVECSDTPSADDQFAVVSSRRKKRARHRTSPQPTASTSSATSAQRDATQLKKKQATMLGKSVSIHTKIAAAKQLRKKSVRCVDNVTTECSVEDMTSFVSDMSVTVLSCFEVKPRRRRSDSLVIQDRKAFRLCVFEEDRHRLLDATKWPNSIVVSDWYFKPRDTVVTNEQAALTIPVNATDPPAAAAAAARQDQSPGLCVTMDQDNTILAEYNMAEYNTVSDGAC